MWLSNIQQTDAISRVNIVVIVVICKLDLLNNR